MAETRKCGLGAFCFTALIAFDAVGVTGCSTIPPQAANMVPQQEQIVAPKAAAKTLRVVAMTVGSPGSTLAQAFAQEPLAQTRITDGAFRDALMNTLAVSGLFKRVSAEGNADYEIDGTVYSQQMSTTGWGWVTATIGVRYKLIETASGTEVWRDSSVSQCDSSIGFKMGIAMQSEANECAMRKNLLHLVEQLAKIPHR